MTADIYDSKTRSYVMSRIRSKNTKPEILVRRVLHKLGYRFRIHCKKLPGSPDIVLPKYKTAIFVHGCFWHSHNCRSGKVPKSRMEYWIPKLERNKNRHLNNVKMLRKLKWRVFVIWECQALDQVWLQLKIEKIFSMKAYAS